ncbi:hypothetical protein PRN20_19035 [Devosia sp. ZB163]|uniref:hypothetical protein n=1 Tax=Devosia sp. ZB163 TaxID=3025938 RepID=UPI002360336A|nr:hypothetical protein [Devosia sp. ZB163]MDC9825835.1 hypothetical protein [Devosia sp. ZB163]
MPISELNRERIQRMLEGHEAALNSTERSLSPDQAMVHRTLLELGRNTGLLELVDEFTDSAELPGRIRENAEEVLRSRGIALPEGVVLTARERREDGTRPLFRLHFPVRRSRMLVDYDAAAGVSTRLSTGSDNGMDL